MDQPRQPKGRPDGGQYAGTGMSLTAGMPPASQPITPTAMYPKDILDLGPAPGAFELGDKAWNTLYSQEAHAEYERRKANGEFRGFHGWREKMRMESKMDAAWVTPSVRLKDWFEREKTRPTDPQGCADTALRGIQQIMPTPPLPGAGTESTPMMIIQKAAPRVESPSAAWRIDKSDDIVNAIHQQPEAVADAVVDYVNRLPDNNTRMQVYKALDATFTVYAHDGRELRDRQEATLYALADYTWWTVHGDTHMPVNPQLYMDPLDRPRYAAAYTPDRDHRTAMRVFRLTGFDPWDDSLFGSEESFGLL